MPPARGGRLASCRVVCNAATLAISVRDGAPGNAGPGEGHKTAGHLKLNYEIEDDLGSAFVVLVGEAARRCQFHFGGDFVFPITREATNAAVSRLIGDLP